MSSANGTFVPYSFGGQIPFYVYQSNSPTTADKVIIGTGSDKWKIEIDTADDNKLKFSYSNDTGSSWSQIVELDPTSD